MSELLVIAEEVQAAADAGRPIVALETAVVTDGLPRIDVRDAPARVREAVGGEASGPLNLVAALAMEAAVRETGAVPATIAIVDGSVRVGLTRDELTTLAADDAAEKASVSNLAACIAGGLSAGTTVAGTLSACELARAIGVDIRVFATGGIGGVHRGWQEQPDVSADLMQIARSPVAVVCAGGKSILDLRATKETLEAMGVPIVGYRSDDLAQFYSTGAGDIPLSMRVDDVETLSAQCAVHWAITVETGSGRGIVVSQPIPDEAGLDRAAVEQWVNEAETNAASTGVTGARRTPYLLQRMSELSDGRTLAANLVLLLNNARLAGALAKVSSDSPSR